MLAGDGSVGVGDEEVEAVEVPLRVAGGSDGEARGLRDIVAGSRLTISAGRGGRARASRALLLEADAGLGPAISRCRWFFRPGETWLTERPMRPGAVRKRVRVLGGHRLRAPPCGPAASKRRVVVSALATDGRVCAQSAAIRSPVMNSTRSHQCEPMSANARDGPPELGVDPPVVVLRRGEPVLQVAAVDQVDATQVPATHAARASRTTGWKR